MQGRKEKPLLLCLHGFKSNSQINSLQMQNLGIFERFRIEHLHGPFLSKTGADDQVELISSGPYYSWIECDEINCAQSESKKSEPLSRLPLNDSHFPCNGKSFEGIMISLRCLLKFLVSHVDNPIDTVYAFSQAAPLVSIISHSKMRKKLLVKFGLHSEKTRNMKPWKFVIFGCAANFNLYGAVYKYFFPGSNCRSNIKYSQPNQSHFGPDAQEILKDKLEIASFHIIGIEDSFKTESEMVYDLFHEDMRICLYALISHTIPSFLSKKDKISKEILDWHNQNKSYKFKRTINESMPSGNISLIQGNRAMTAFTQRTNIKNVVQKEKQQKIGNNLDPAYFHTHQVILNEMIKSNDISLLQMLKNVDEKSKPALYSINEEDELFHVSYNEIISFIQGDGDLQRIQATKSSTIAYILPIDSSGITAALAFLTLSSQCTAAPLDPSYSATELLYALEQLHPDIIISFNRTNDTMIERVATLSCNCRFYKAISTKKGFFRYENISLNENFQDDQPFENDVNGVGLLLRTSGTTSKPKVVPLKVGNLTSNALSIAQSLELESSDIALNAMPLFHIGGISSNLLSSLSVGASVILLPSFDPNLFLKTLFAKEYVVSPTWYSGVPTMHAEITSLSETMISLKPDEFTHRLRFIRSGADSLPQRLMHDMQQVFACPIIETYSMTEQMPICQPRCIGNLKSGSVGQPLSTSLCIVDADLWPIPYGPNQVGEVCISGSTVFEGYRNNEEENKKAFFYIGSMKWFRTGDMGFIDKEGFLFLSGRKKEIIKRGGKQISPVEVEECCVHHSSIKKCVAFGIPDAIYGERLGLAIVRELSSSRISDDQLLEELKNLVLSNGLQSFKAPEAIVYILNWMIPVTASKKIIRTGLARRLNVKPIKDMLQEQRNHMKPVFISDSFTGLRFVLALGILFNHIGDFGTSLNHARFFCLHVPAFFYMGGFSLAAGTKNVIEKNQVSFVFQRIAVMHPIYLVSLILAVVNFCIRCNPSTYTPNFDLRRQPDAGSHFICQSPFLEQPYGTAMVSSLLMHLFALQAWPFSLCISWFILIYPWFQSCYYFCFFCFPSIHKLFYEYRLSTKKLWSLMIFWLTINYFVVGIFPLYLLLSDYHPNIANMYALMIYLFPPGWIPSFAMGIGSYFLFLKYRPNEKLSSWKWGILTDILTVFILGIFLSYTFDVGGTTPNFIDPDISSLDQRYFAFFISRSIAPFIFLWVYGIAVGKGLTCKLFSIKFIVSRFAPASYNMYLFHQVIQEWYFIATRGYWYAEPKPYYWFSPKATPVPWWEFLIICVITIAFSLLLEVYVNGWLVKHSTKITRTLLRIKFEKVKCESVSSLIFSVIKNITGMEPSSETTMSEAGLSSMTTFLLLADLENIFPAITLSVRHIIDARTVGGLIQYIEQQIEESNCSIRSSGIDSFSPV